MQEEYTPQVEQPIEEMEPQIQPEVVEFQLASAEGLANQIARDFDNPPPSLVRLWSPSLYGQSACRNAATRPVGRNYAAL